MKKTRSRKSRDTVPLRDRNTCTQADNRKPENDTDYYLETWPKKSKC